MHLALRRIVVPNEFAAQAWRRCLRLEDRYAILLLAVFLFMTMPLYFLLTMGEDMAELKEAGDWIMLSFSAGPLLLTLAYLWTWWTLRTQTILSELSWTAGGSHPWVIGRLAPFQTLAAGAFLPLFAVIVLLNLSQGGYYTQDLTLLFGSLDGTISAWCEPLLAVAAILVFRSLIKAVLLLFFLLLPTHLHLFLFLIYGGHAPGFEANTGWPISAFYFLQMSLTTFKILLTITTIKLLPTILQRDLYLRN